MSQGLLIVKYGDYILMLALYSSALKRDIYFMNLNNIDSDSELLSAFASIPRKSVVVFEDIDAMTPVSSEK